MTDTPLTYSDIKTLAAALRRPAETLIALSDSNDPFYLLPRRQRLAEWFATEVWPLLLNPEGGVHVRRVHYVLVSLPATDRPQKPDGTAYTNTHNDWRLLVDASRDARELGLVDAGLFIDRRAAEPMVYMPVGEDCDTTIAVVGTDINEYSESVPSFTYTPRHYAFPSLPDYDITPPDFAEPYAIEIWIEKSTMADVLEPIARRYGVTLVPGVGELSLTRVHEHVERVIEHKRKTRVLYLSDFDPAGNDMPVSIARKIEFILRRDGLDDLDIRLDPLLLTREQVEHYRLPRIPIKDGERRKASFEERYGQGAVELDALEALHPGELARLVIERIEVYREPTQVAREEIEETVSWFEQDAEAIRQSVLREHAATLAQLRAQFDDLQAAIRPHQEALAEIAADFTARYAESITEHVGAINEQAAAFYEQASEVWSEITDDLEDRAPDPDAVEWPEPYDADEPVDPLFDSERGYLEQIDRYKRHQGKPTERRRRNGRNGGTP